MSTDNQVAMQIIDGALKERLGKQVVLHVEGMDKIVIEEIGYENLTAARVTAKGGKVYRVPLSRIVAVEAYTPYESIGVL